MPDLILKALVKGHDKLLPYLYEFNFSPVQYIHPSWLESFIKPVLFERLRKSCRARKRLSALILRRFNLQQEYCFDFEDQARRLALLDRDSLGRLIYVAGIALNAEGIAKTIERQSLLALKESIGEDAYWFALKKAPFLLGRTSLPLPERHDGESWHDYALRCGAKALESCVSGEPPALTKRVQLKLPRTLAHDFGQHPNLAMKHQASFILQKVLLKEVNPAWAPWFT